MKFFKKALAGVAVAAALTTSAQAGLIAMSDLSIGNLAIRNLTSGTLVGPGDITINSGTRFGTDSATLNLANVSNFTPFAGPTGDANAATACVGTCGAPLITLYGGSISDNATSHIAAPAAFNYALGDMFVSGNAISGGAAGLTRANASITGPTSSASANGNIQNSIAATTIFTAQDSFTADFLAVFDTFVKTYIDPIHYGTSGSSISTASTTFLLTVFDITSGTQLLTWLPTEFNKAFSTDTAINGPEVVFSLAGTIDSPDVLLTTDHQYQLTIAQNGQAGVTSSVPEPTSVALLGLGLIGMAAARRRRNVK